MVFLYTRVLYHLIEQESVFARIWNVEISPLINLPRFMDSPFRVWKNMIYLILPSETMEPLHDCSGQKLRAYFVHEYMSSKIDNPSTLPLPLPLPHPHQYFCSRQD